YNRMNEQAGGRLLPARLIDVCTPRPQDHRDSWHIASLDAQRPALASLVEPTSLYESVLVYRHLRMAAEPQTRVLARLDDAEPLLVERPVGRGRVLMLGVTAHVDWSNLPLRTIFLPLVTQLTLDLADVERSGRDLTAGQPIVLPLRSLPAEVEVTRPGGEVLRLRAAAERESPAAREFRYADTHEVGVYLLRDSGSTPPQTAYSVNFAPEEADPTRIGRPQLESLLGGAPLVMAENPNDLSAAFSLLREGKSLWIALLAAVLVVLVFETYFSNRMRAKTV
ncbi:MAG: hypothetical protein ABFC96_04840, partial [Thermoguttaceae bacterium]